VQNSVRIVKNVREEIVVPVSSQLRRRGIVGAVQTKPDSTSVASPGMGHWGRCPPPWSVMHAPFFSYILGKRIVFFLLPEAFCGLKYAENAIAAGALPRTPLGELTTLPQTP